MKKISLLSLAILVTILSVSVLPAFAKKGGKIKMAITNIQVVHEAKTATITWNTTLESSSKVEYSPYESVDTSPVSNILSDNVQKTSHSMNLTNLLPDTEYYFVITATPHRGKAKVSLEESFITNTYDEFDISVTREVSSTTYTPGDVISVTVTLTGTGTDSVLALGYKETIPENWILETRTDNGPFTIYRQIDNVLEYASLSIFTESSFPVSFSYDIRTATSSTGIENISGQSIYRTDGPQLESNTVTTTFTQN